MAKKKETLSAFADRAGISVSYAHELRAGKKQPDPIKAADIYRRTGHKFGILADAETRDANVLVKLATNAGLLA